MTDQRISQFPASQPREGYLAALARGLKRRASSPSWLARATGVGLCMLSIGFVLLFLVVLERGGELALVTRPLSMRIALALPYLVVVLTLGTAVGAILAWRHRYWSVATRIHQTLLAVLGIGFTWQLVALGFVTV